MATQKGNIMINLKEFRNRYELTQVEFSEIIGVPRSTYVPWELGKASPTNKNMINLEKAIRQIESEHAIIEQYIDKLEEVKKQEKIQRFYKKYNHYEEKPHKWKKLLLNLFWSAILLVLFYMIL